MEPWAVRDTPGLTGSSTESWPIMAPLSDTCGAAVVLRNFTHSATLFLLPARQSSFVFVGATYSLSYSVFVFLLFDVTGNLHLFRSVFPCFVCWIFCVPLSHNSTDILAARVADCERSSLSSRGFHWPFKEDGLRLGHVLGHLSKRINSTDILAARTVDCEFRYRLGGFIDHFKKTDFG